MTNPSVQCRIGNFKSYIYAMHILDGLIELYSAEADLNSQCFDFKRELFHFNSMKYY